MKTPSEAYWVGLVAFIIAGLCLAAVVVIAIQERRRTGQLPPEMRPKPGSTGWFGLAFVLWIFARSSLSKALVTKFPLYIIVPGIDLGLELAFLAFAGFALSHAFRTQWNRQLGLWIVYCLIFPALGGFYFYLDVGCLRPMPWAWILAGIVGIALAPFLARFTFEEFHIRRVMCQGEQEEEPRPHIYRPGEPME